MKVFISYAHKDGGEAAKWLWERLRRDRQEVWFDEKRLTAGASWTEGIEEGIDGCEVLFALLSNGSFRSDICRAEQLRALRRGKKVVPLLIESGADRPIHLETKQFLRFTDPEQYDEAYGRLVEGLGNDTEEFAREHLARLPEKFRRTPTFIPATESPHLIERPQELRELRDLVLAEGTSRRVAITALKGMAGIGKTELCKMLCYEAAVLDAFPDGVIWVDIGPDPGDLVLQMRDVGWKLKNPESEQPPVGYDDPQSARNRLREALRRKAALLVLDNVWDAGHVREFMADEPRCRILFSTRDSAIASNLQAAKMDLSTFVRAQSIEYLRRATGTDDPDLEQVANRLGDHPLGLKLAGVWLQDGKSATDWLKAHRRFSRIRTRMGTTDPLESLKASFDLSLERLKTEECDLQSFFHALAVFPKGEWTPISTVFRLWEGMASAPSDVDPDEILQEIQRLHLADGRQIDGQDQFRLHDLLFEYADESLGEERTKTHQTLLQSYNPNEIPWSQTDLDGYMYRELILHLIAADRTHEARSLLFDFDWLQAKLELTEPNALIIDCDRLKTGQVEDEIASLGRVFSQASHILARDPYQLASQLVGRLDDSKESDLGKLLRQAKGWRGRPWLQPLKASLSESPALVRILKGHKGPVSGLALTRDARLAVSASWDQTVKVWDMEKGREVLELVGHTGAVNAVAFAEDGRFIISGSDDRWLKLWDSNTGSQLATLEGHTDSVTSIAVADGRGVAVSASADKTLKVWDLEKRQERFTLSGHEGPVNAVVVTSTTAGDLWAISASDDRTLRIWDLDSGQPLRTLVGHTRPVQSVAVWLTGESLYAATASDDGKAKVWDLTEGREHLTFEGHTSDVFSVAATADSRRVVSGSIKGQLRVWDPNDGHAKAAFVAHENWISSLALTTDGRRIVSASYDHTIKVWDLQKTDTEAQPRDHTESVFFVAAKKDGARAMSLSREGTMKLWDTETLEALLTIATGPIVAGAMTSDAKWALLASRADTRFASTS